MNAVGPPHRMGIQPKAFSVCLSEMLNDAFEDMLPVFTADDLLTGTFRVGHESSNVSFSGADSRDVLDRTIWIGVLLKVTR